MDSKHPEPRSEATGLGRGSLPRRNDRMADQATIRAQRLEACRQAAHIMGVMQGDKPSVDDVVVEARKISAFVEEV